MRRQPAKLSGEALAQHLQQALINGVPAETLTAYRDALLSAPAEQPKALPAPPSFIDWDSDKARHPAPFPWVIQHWLSPDPTLLAATGGVGKSLFAQALASSIALGAPYLGIVDDPQPVLYWNCEDRVEVICQRQIGICSHFGVSIDALKDRVFIDARRGLDSTLFANDGGELRAQPAMKLLRDQVNDQRIGVLILDNLAHVYGGDENSRHEVTRFTSAIVGLRDPLAPIFVGHTARGHKSEFSGSSAWENACRMRWFLGTKLPDQDPDDQDGGDADVLYLAKRKTNYTAKDFQTFRFNHELGIIEPQSPVGSNGNGSADLYAGLKKQKAEQIVLSALRRLNTMGEVCAATKGPSYLPAKVCEFKLNEGLTKGELSTAMHELMVRGDIVRGQVGTYANRSPRMGLVLAQNIAQNIAH